MVEYREFNSAPASDAQVAYLRLRDMVVSGEIRPGEVLRERQLTDRLKLGRTPVREAVQRLAWQRVVSIFPRRGIVVTKLGLSDVQEIFEAREAIESTLAELAAIRRSDEEAQAMSRLGKFVTQEAGSQNYRAFLEHDQELHRAIASAARNTILFDSADQLLMLSAWVWHQYFEMRGSRPTDYFDHHLILDAIIEQKPDAARRAMASHIRESHRIVRQAL